MDISYSYDINDPRRNDEIASFEGVTHIPRIGERVFISNAIDGEFYGRVTDIEWCYENRDPGLGLRWYVNASVVPY
jgi:hypothetical protein